MGGSEEVNQQETDSEQTDDSRLAICLVSGGMDSCVTAAIATEENDELAFLHVSYGREQKNANVKVSRRIAVTTESDHVSSFRSINWRALVVHR